MTVPSTVQPVRGGEVLVGQCQRRGRVVGPAAVARGDREALDLRVQHLQRRELLEAGVAARMLVDAELDQRAVEACDLQRDDLVDEGAAVDRCDRTLMRTERPGVHLLAGDPDRLRGVPPDGDRHVAARRIGRLHVRRRNPPLLEFQRRPGDAPVHQRCHRQRLHATADDDLLCSGADLRRRVGDRGQAARTVPVDGLSREPTSMPEADAA